MERKEVNLGVSGHHSTAEDFKSAVGKGDAPGTQECMLGRAASDRSQLLYAASSQHCGQQGCLSHGSYLCAKWP